MFSSSERLRDISSVGLKTVISEFPRTTQAVATSASRNITGKMVGAIGKPVSVCVSVGGVQMAIYLVLCVGFKPIRSAGDLGYFRRSHP